MVNPYANCGRTVRASPTATPRIEYDRFRRMAAPYSVLVKTCPAGDHQ